MNRFDFLADRPLATDHLRYGPLWAALGAALVALVVFGSLSGAPNAGPIALNDKLVHLGVYATLMAWFAQLFRHDLTRLLCGLCFVALGIAMEYLQGLIPTRQFELADMVANTSGVLLAWALSYTRFGNLLAAFERLVGRGVSRA